MLSESGWGLVSGKAGRNKACVCVCVCVRVLIQTTSVAEALGRDKVAGAARAASNAETSEDSTLLQSQPLLPKVRTRWCMPGAKQHTARTSCAGAGIRAIVVTDSRECLVTFASVQKLKAI